MKKVFSQVAVVVATTIGAGMFALPSIVHDAGWALFIFYLVALGILLAFIHGVYLLVLEKVRERKKLVGLVRDSVGRTAEIGAFVAVEGGQLLTLLAYIILGQAFLLSIFPGLPPEVAVVAFWLVASWPLLLNIKCFARFEEWGTVGMVVLIAVLFLGSNVGEGIANAPVMNAANPLLPFGVILFALAGWTAVEPVYELDKDKKSLQRTMRALFAGTGISALLYAFFTLAILGMPTAITSDTISGFTDPLYKMILALIGLFAIWTSYMPVGREAVHALEDAGMKKTPALLAILLLPLALFGMGLSDFVRLIGFIGGVLLALQYIFILVVGKKLLRPQGTVKIAFWMLYIILAAGIIYELYYFVYTGA